MSDDVPAEVLRRRKLFQALRDEVQRLKPDETRVSIDLTDQEMLDALDKIERILEYAEVARNAQVYCDRLVTDVMEMDFSKR